MGMEVAQWNNGTCNQQVMGSNCHSGQKVHNNLWQVVHTYLLTYLHLCASVTKQYNLVPANSGDALWLGK